jgi:Toastrack DUF4097
MPQSARCSLPSRLRAAKPRYGEARRRLLSESQRQAKAAALATGLCVAGVLAGGVLSACDVTIKDGDIKNVSVQARASQEWSRHYPLAPGGVVEILNGNGSIEVVAGAPGVVDIAAVLEARAMSETRAKEILSSAKVEESAAADHIRVATVFTFRGRGSGGLESSYKVAIPADARLEMTGNNGTLKAEGLRGHVKAMVVNGGIELTSMSGTIDAAAVNAHVSAKMSQVTGPVRLESSNGRISLDIPKSAKATLNVRSVNGGITVSGLTTSDEGSGRRIRTLESQLNGGGPEIDVRVTNGRISITGTDGPESNIESQGVERPGVQSPGVAKQGVRSPVPR